MKKIAILLLNGYRKFLSPSLGYNCRFFPSCSCYAIQAIENKGLMVGILFTLKRILKCHPLHAGGYDPIE